METIDVFEAIAERHDIDVYAFTAYCNNHHITEKELLFDADDHIKDFTDSYVGHYHGEAEFAQERARECGDDMNVPDYILDCVDWQEVWDSTLRHDYWSDDGHIFSNI